MRRAHIQPFGSVPSYRYGIETYDPDELGLGPMMHQSSGAGEANWAGPLPISVGRPMEASTQIPAIYPWAMRWSQSATSQKDWIFFADNAAAAITRRIVMYEYDRLTASLTWRGFITVSFPSPTTTYTIRALRMTYDLYTTGTVAVSGTAVTGTSTDWTTNRVPAGCRIGFGSTDPTQISTWYEISSIGSNTAITLGTSAGTIAGGTAYVIEDLRAVIGTTNNTATSGGLYIVKGLSYDIFSSIGTSISAAVSTDNVRACYWLKSSGTISETVNNGMGLETGTYTSQMCWFGSGTTTQRLYKFNIRASLTLATGADTTAFQLSTAASATLTGTASQANNGRIATLNHGPGSGTVCYYFSTTTRVYRTKAVSTIANTDGTFISAGDNMTEIPVGGASSVAVSSLLNSVEHSSTLDMLFIPVAVSTTPFRNYATQYKTNSSQFDRSWGTDTRQLLQSAADATITPHVTQTGLAYSMWLEGGLAYLAQIGTTAITNVIFVVPLGADWEYTAATDSFIITPSITTTNAETILSVFAEESRVIGGSTAKNLGIQPEPWRVFYRTSGISDDSGGWTAVDQTGVINASGTSLIQLKFEFRTLGYACVPARLHSYGVVWDDNNTHDNWQFSSNIGTSLATKKFGFRQSVAYGGTVPRLLIEIYDAETGSLLDTDDSVTQGGTWEKSTNAGVAWGSYNSTDRANEDTYIRYTPASLADNIKVRTVLRHY